MVKRFSLPLLIVCLLLVSGCATTTSEPTRFYRLSESTPAPAVRSEKELTLTLGPVVLASYLERSQIVTRLNGNQLKLNNFDHWSGDLAFNIQQVISDQLLAYFPKLQLLHFPQQDRSEGTYQLKLMIMEFDGRLDGDVVLKADWSLYRYQEGRARDRLVSKRSEVTVPIEKPTIEGQVVAMSEALHQLVNEVIAELAKP